MISRTSYLKYVISVLICIALILTGCMKNKNEGDDIETLSGESIEKILSGFSSINPIENRVSHYAEIHGKHYFDLNVLLSDASMNKISDHIPYGNPFMATIYGIGSDGEFLYCHAWNLQTKQDEANHFRLGLYKIDVKNNQIFPLHEWESPNTINNNYSFAFHEDYIYFFKSVDNTNELCRIKKDGTSFEQLTNNDGAIYTGLFFVGDVIFYQKDGNLYKTANISLDDGILVCENIYTIELYDDYFYFLSPTTNGIEFQLTRMKADDTDTKEVLINKCSDTYLIKDHILYFCKYNPIVVAENTEGKQVTNANQGAIYAYDIQTGSESLFIESNELNIIRIYNVSDEAVIVRANTNEDIKNSFDTGLTVNYYLITAENAIIIPIVDRTLELQGT